MSRKTTTSWVLCLSFEVLVLLLFFWQRKENTANKEMFVYYSCFRRDDRPIYFVVLPLYLLQTIVCSSLQKLLPLLMTSLYHRAKKPTAEVQRFDGLINYISPIWWSFKFLRFTRNLYVWDLLFVYFRDSHFCEKMGHFYFWGSKGKSMPFSFPGSSVFFAKVYQATLLQ